MQVYRASSNVKLTQAEWRATSRQQPDATKLRNVSHSPRLRHTTEFVGRTVIPKLELGTLPSHTR
jgi:hypothetical protein